MDLARISIWYLLVMSTSLAIVSESSAQYGFFSDDLVYIDGATRPRDLPLDGRVKVIPKTDSVFELVNLLKNDSVRRALGLRDDEYAALLEVMKKGKSIVRVQNTERLSRDEFKAQQSSKILALKADIDEIMSPEKQRRLRQLAYQIEVSYLGYSVALLHGRLGDAVKIHENQKTALTDKATLLQAQMSKEMDAVARKYQDLILKELSTEQRNIAKECLGDPFQFTPAPMR